MTKLTEICENRCKNLSGKAQVKRINLFIFLFTKKWVNNLFIFFQILPALKFLQNFIDENPLICCYDEINCLRKLLQDCDSLKLKQKLSTIILEIHREAYFFKTKIYVPDDYPTTAAK